MRKSCTAGDMLMPLKDVTACLSGRPVSSTLPVAAITLSHSTSNMRRGPGLTWDTFKQATGQRMQREIGCGFMILRLHKSSMRGACRHHMRTACCATQLVQVTWRFPQSLL